MTHECLHELARLPQIGNGALSVSVAVDLCVLSDLGHL
jgi:hypothetical protein